MLTSAGLVAVLMGLIWRMFVHFDAKNEQAHAAIDDRAEWRAEAHRAALEAMNGRLHRDHRERPGHRRPRRAASRSVRGDACRRAFKMKSLVLVLVALVLCPLSVDAQQPEEVDAQQPEEVDAQQPEEVDAQQPEEVVLTEDHRQLVEALVALHELAVQQRAELQIERTERPQPDLQAVASFVTVLISGLAVLVSAYAARNSSRAAEASLNASQSMLKVEVLRHDVTALTTVRGRFKEVFRFVDQPASNDPGDLFPFVDRKLQYYETIYSPYKDYFSPEFQGKFKSILDKRRDLIIKMATTDSGVESGDLNELQRTIERGVRLVEDDGFNEISSKLSEKLKQLTDLTQ